MRAETQANIEKIRRSLTLLGQRLGIETAQHRLEEFNARVEDPKLGRVAVGRAAGRAPPRK
jgi:peptide chain release factor 2